MAISGPKIVLNHFSQSGQPRNRHMSANPAGRKKYIAAMVTQGRAYQGSAGLDSGAAPPSGDA